MPRISISGDGKDSFSPDDIVRIQFQSDILGEKISPFVSFTVPRFATRIDFIDVLLKSTESSREWLVGNEFRISAYSSSPIPSISGSNQLNIKIATTAPTLTRDDLVNFTASLGSPLRNINGNNYRVTAKSQNEIYLNFTVPRSLIATGSGSVASASNSIREIATILKGKEYTVSLPNGYISQLIYNDSVRDIPIFCYRQSTSTLTQSDQKKLMIDATTVSESSPPAYSATLNTEYGKKQNYTRFIADVNGGYVEFYIAIARYTLSGSTWTGQWLHRNTDGNTYWALAKRAT